LNHFFVNNLLIVTYLSYFFLLFLLWTWWISKSNNIRFYILEISLMIVNFDRFACDIFQFCCFWIYDIMSIHWIRIILFILDLLNIFKITKSKWTISNLKFRTSILKILFDKNLLSWKLYHLLVSYFGFIII
jgi:hypothetical protein